ncbi:MULTISPECIES: 2OG-Fe(II) oxygenase [Vibrio]|jgi:SM-20-related protein|uniref:2OG-Fe(II) oxygenase n=1 Tax=Vibrio TaxID=662 RepID=UPI000BFFA430|nr:MULTISPECIES: 2OG-Fe(II) oxygenase [unclassified Vibrio]PHJ42978.1 SM-20 protein [Vibrio sp. PID17_43]RIZ51046.1 SM-20 protein [Vibrio sp. PID23_8]
MQQLISSLLSKGYYVWDDFLTPDQVEHLRFCLPHRWEEAHVGHHDKKMLERNIRSDDICWLSSELGEPVQRFLTRMKQVKKVMNQKLYLGLDDYEAHFAKYRPGCFYKKHLDSFQKLNYRRVSTVLYLNDNWQPADGGELVIYDQRERELQRILPKAGRLLLFFSEQHPHEVLTCNRTRFSIAGWFKVSNVLPG